MTLREQYEWCRMRLGILTPNDRGMQGAKVGDEPEWAMEPSNYRLRSFIQSACNIINRHIGVGDAGSVRSLSVPATTANGPLAVSLAAVPGIRDRDIIAIRRAWWYDGSTAQRLDTFNLSQLDAAKDAYISDPPGIPRRFAIEGYTLYLDPGPATAGTFQFMATSGVLMPVDDNDSFDQIPGAYDECILYVALVEYCKTKPNDAEMVQRAQMFAPDAAAGMERLASWFNGGSNPESQPSISFDARSMRRQTR